MQQTARAADSEPLQELSVTAQELPIPYTAEPGDSISTILGTSDPKAIEAFMLANNLSDSTIIAGKTYDLPTEADYEASTGTLGQATLDADNARIAASVDTEAAAAPSTANGTLSQQAETVSNAAGLLEQGGASQFGIEENPGSIETNQVYLDSNGRFRNAQGQFAASPFSEDQLAESQKQNAFQSEAGFEASYNFLNSEVSIPIVNPYTFNLLGVQGQVGLNLESTAFGQAQLSLNDNGLTGSLGEVGEVGLVYSQGGIQGQYGEANYNIASTAQEQVQGSVSVTKQGVDLNGTAGFLGRWQRKGYGPAEHQHSGSNPSVSERLCGSVVSLRQYCYGDSERKQYV